MGRKNHLAKIKRLLQLQRLLQDEPAYDADQLASLLGVSKRTIHRDLNTLQALGIDVHFDRREDSYQIQGAYALAPALKAEEVLLVELALEALPEISQQIFSDTIQSIRQKLYALYRQEYSMRFSQPDETSGGESL